MKSVVYKKVYKYALEILNNENSKLSKTSHLPARTSLIHQDYFEFLSSSEARLIFAIRSGTVNVKTNRKYKYGDADMCCRLCDGGEESVEHIVNECKAILKSSTIENVFSLLKDDVKVIAHRVKKFNDLIEDRESEKC